MILRRLPMLLIAALLTSGFARRAEAGKPGESLGRKYTTIERMTPERLKAAHEDVARIKAQRRDLGEMPGYHDYKAIFHAHAEDSAHTGGTRPEMLEDAKRAGVSAIFLSDHFRPPRDFIDGSWRGLHDGVLFVPGSETHGFLIYPMKSILEKMSEPPGEIIKCVTEGDGLIFLSHVEARMAHPMDGLTGMEIYNRHADANDDGGPTLMWLMQAVTDPVRYAEVAESLRLYPDEMLASQLDYPADYLKKWDAESQKQRVSGVAANDCHHNQVFIVKMVDEETVLLGTVVDKDEDMRKVKAEQRPGIREMTKGHQPGDVLARLDFDPYYRSFFNESTHVLAPELTEASLRTALKAGHAYVSHDWMCDPKGFVFGVTYEPPMEGRKGSSKKVSEVRGIMGDEVTMEQHLQITANLPIPCKIRLIRDGTAIVEKEVPPPPGGWPTQFFQAADTPGVYRIEAWLTVDGEERPWIYSNPIYVRDKTPPAK